MTGEAHGHPKNRQKFLAKLTTSATGMSRRPYDPRRGTEIVRRLRALGARDESWVVSPSKRLDARATPLVEAITNIVGENDGSIVSAGRNDCDASRLDNQPRTRASDRTWRSSA